jgi:uncharacterized protein
MASTTDRGPQAPHLLYLHGFRSSPQSFKAQRLSAWLAEHRPDVRWWCPQLPPSPRAAMAMIEAGIADWPRKRSSVMGSSLGGFYATIVSQKFGWPGVLVNPAVNPARDLASYIGEQTAFHSPLERFYFRAEFVDELRELTPAALRHPERLLAVIAKGDEVLDWREMSTRYQHAKLRLVDGSDHALSDFEHHLPAILQFLKLCD